MKFSKGEIALLVVGFPGACHEHLLKYVNQEVEIILYDCSEHAYEVMARDGRIFLADESCLRKRRPPEQPADCDFQEWFNKTIVTKIPDMTAVYRTIRENPEGIKLAQSNMEKLATWPTPQKE